MVQARQGSLTDLIGRIYDCVLDPERWPSVMRDIGAAIGGSASQLYVADRASGRQCYLASWQEPRERNRERKDRLTACGADWLAGMLRRSGHNADAPILLDEPPQDEGFRLSGMHREWVRPFYCNDVLNVILFRDGSRIGLFGAARPDQDEIRSAADLVVMRALAPHLRRATTIATVLEARALEAEALRGALDGIAVGIGVVAADGAVLHVNSAAQAMLAAEGGPIRTAGGRLAARRAEATRDLQAAIAAAADGEERVNGQRLGVVLDGPDAACAPAVAHVLPLGGRAARRDLVPRAAAAVFVTHAPEGAADGLAIEPARMAAVARAFHLTTAEARLLERLVRGETLPRARAALGIAETTAKTHLAHIFDKAGVSRQADLIALVARLVPPLNAG